MIALRQQNTPILLEALHNVSNPDSPQYGQYWTQEQINKLVATPQHEVDLFIDFFKSRDITCEVRGGDALACEGAQLDKLKNPIYAESNHLFYDFMEISASSSKTTDTPRSFVSSHNVGNGDGYVGREVMVNLYNITHSEVNNETTSICAVEYQNMGGISETDLELQQQLNNQPKNPITHIVGTNQSPMTEAQLDVQMMSQVAQGSQIWMWGGKQWLYSFAVNFLNATEVPEVLSMSWGWSARDQCTAGLGPCPGNMSSSRYVNRTNMEYVKMGLRGITVLVSSGDAGAPGRMNEICTKTPFTVNPAFPGSSPYITSVGATYLVPNQTTNNWNTKLCQEYGCVNGTKELPCNYAETGWTTGGGFALYDELRPSWQNTVVEEYLNSKVKMPTKFHSTGRGYPDVAALGHYCPTIMNGNLLGVDGTSCSSPVFASLVALLNDHQKSKGKPLLGFMNPLLYKMKDTFNDITQGNNWCTEVQCCNSDFGYQAGKGWDPVTGLGTPNFGRMLEYLDTH